MLLVHVGQFHRFAARKGAVVGLVEAHDEAEQGGFAHAVRTNDADDAGGRQGEVEVGVEHLVAERLGHVLGLDNLVAQARAVGDEDFEVLLLFLLILVE